jgi:hypothetical protein
VPNIPSEDRCRHEINPQHITKYHPDPASFRSRPPAAGFWGDPLKPKMRSAPLKISHTLIRSTILLLLSLVLICKTTAYAEDQTSEYKVKAVYLYNFTKFVSWPDTTLPGDTQTINICVLGKNPFGSLLEPITHMKTQGKTITIEYIEDIRALEKKSCHILFISASEQGALAELLRKTATMPILTVSDMDGFVRHDGIIGFVVKEDKVRLEINLSAARQTGLTISAKLLEIATVIP